MSYDTHQLFGEIKVRMSSSLLAKLRLKHVIAADRAAVPCGRWVNIRSRHPEWLLLRRLRVGEVPDWRPIYRYEVRR